jgi:hypothetical protein
MRLLKPILRPNFYLQLEAERNALSELVNYHYRDIEFTGDGKKLCLSQGSMLSSNDPYCLVQRLTGRARRWSHSSEERKILETLPDLIKTVEYPATELPMDSVSGIDAASDENWSSLKEYAQSLLPRRRWPDTCSHWYGFETDEDFSYLCNEVIGKKAFAIEFHTWSNRYYISNTDGSHRIAALYRQNHEQNRGVMLRLPLFERDLDKRLMTDLLSSFHILITTESAAIHIRGVLKELGLGCLFCGGVEDKSNYIKVIWIKRIRSDFLELAIEFLSKLGKDKVYVVSSSA